MLHIRTIFHMLMSRRIKLSKKTHNITLRSSKLVATKNIWQEGQLRQLIQGKEMSNSERVSVIISSDFPL